ncbi:MAG: FISUMP domain-containing protein [Bacteroidales bacterium]|nr:FISUMP domain-containing protein [Bacteroidales bacterium]
MRNFLYLILAVVIFTSCQSCKKEQNLPTVATSQIYNVKNNSVISGGKILDDGNATIIACGLCYGSTSNLTITNEKTTETELIDNTFFSTILNLEAGKTYYLRAYATNRIGTSYGEAVSFQTSGANTSVTTLEATNVQFAIATFNGSVTTDNDQTTISFIYGENENNLDQSISVNTPSKSATTYSVNAVIPNLKDNTTYYFAIKAVNNCGAVIGETKSFKTLDGHLNDIDGNVYKLVGIGNQIWMAENLKVTHYNDGTEIPNVTDTQEWGGLTSGAYCDYDNNPENSATYGRLYNAYSVWTEKLAPAGWHVPSDAEWSELFNFVNRDGGALKETGLTHWVSPNTGATNSSGFNALPNGGRPRYLGETTYKYDHIGYAAMWWASDKDSSSPIISNGAYLKFVSRNNTNIYDNWIMAGTNGFGIRLIKDE